MSPQFDFSDALIRIREEFPDHLRLLQEASIMETVGQYAFVHAGTDPGAPVSDQSLAECIQIRSKFLDHVGRLSHVVVHGHTPLDPPRPVVTENRISLDTHAWATGVLSLASFRLRAGYDQILCDQQQRGRTGSADYARPRIGHHPDRIICGSGDLRHAWALLKSPSSAERASIGVGSNPGSAPKRGSVSYVERPD